MRPSLRFTLFFVTFVVASMLSLSPSASAQTQMHVVVPATSMDQGIGADGLPMLHTNVRILAPGGGKMNFGATAIQPSEFPPFPGFLFETPASLACIYKLVVAPLHGCNPNLTTANPSGGNRAIAVVDFFHDPTAETDLATFSAQFGLPAADLTVVFAQGTQPAVGPGGDQIETSLDIEYAHAMAPEAKLFLVETANNSFTNVFAGVTVAANLVAAAGGGEVSMSFGSGEFTQETTLDPIFTTPGVVFIASSGDSPGVSYPSASPNVISAGGTSISRNTSSGDFILESTWQDAGGGPSQVETRPAFQNVIKHIVGSARGTPDIAFDANPSSGVWVFDTNTVDGTGWFIVGGTSVSAPSLSGIINAAGGFRASSQAENTEIYSNIGVGNRFRDIEFGNCGLNVSNFAVDGWDFCTGVGSDQGLKGK